MLNIPFYNFILAATQSFYILKNEKMPSISPTYTQNSEIPTGNPHQPMDFIRRPLSELQSPLKPNEENNFQKLFIFLWHEHLHIN